MKHVGRPKKRVTLCIKDNVNVRPESKSPNRYLSVCIKMKMISYSKTGSATKCAYHTAKTKGSGDIITSPAREGKHMKRVTGLKILLGAGCGGSRL